MNAHAAVPAVLFAALFLGSAASAAVRFEGSFAGLASGSLSGVVLDRAPVTGMLAVDLETIPPVHFSGPDFSTTVVPGGSVALTFALSGQTFRYDGRSDGDTAIRLEYLPTGPEVVFDLTFESTNIAVYLTLAGPLFDGLDLSTLGPGPVDLSRSGAVVAHYHGDPDHFDVELTSVAFTMPAVPEPSTWGLMLVGLAAVGAVVRRK